MSQVVAPDCEKLALQATVDNVIDDTTLKLYQNDLTPDETTGIGAFTECTFSGYAAEDLSVAGAWGVLFEEANYYKSDYDTEIVFNHNGGGVTNDVYGYFVVKNGTGELLFSARFPNGPYNMETASDSLGVKLQFTSRSEFAQV